MQRFMCKVEHRNTSISAFMVAMNAHYWNDEVTVMYPCDGILNSCKNCKECLVM